MSKVTDIKQQVKKQNRYSIFFDDKYLFSLSENELLASGIKINKEYDQTQLEQLKTTSVLDKAYMRSLDLIARRPRSKWEIENYLKTKEYNQEIIEIIIDKLIDKNYLNDYKFSKSWVDSRRLLKKVSKQRLKLELRQKRVEDEIIKQVLEEDEGNEIEILKDLIERKKSQSKYHDKNKLIQYLMRQGFRYDDIKTAMDS